MASEQTLTPELQSIRDFLAECMPFDQLDRQELACLAAHVEVSQHRRGERFSADNDEGGLRILRSGAAELRTADDKLLDRFGDRVSFHIRGLMQEQPSVRAVLIEDSLIYRLPEEKYQAVRQRHREFDRFFHCQRSRRVRRVGMQESAAEMLQHVKDVMSAEVLTVAPQSSIRSAAEMMTERRVSSVLVTENSELLGIVTDRDLRSRCIARGVDLQSPISNIMTTDPSTLDIESTLFDAILFMTRSGYHHLPVLEKGRLAGIVTSSDLLLAKGDDPVYLVQRLGRKSSVAELNEVVKQMPELMVRWVNAGVSAAKISRILTAVSDAVTQRLIELYIQQHGEAPCSFCWLGFGSQGRSEQLLGGDQDNALLISDEMEAADAPWFESLAHWVCDGLNACGYVYCPGEVMATTAEWRQPLAGWRQTVSQWARTPTPDAVMRVSIFFDVRCVFGNQTLSESLQQHMLETASGNTIFLAALAENVLENTPPLGIFRQFVVERNGEHRDELNLKKRGILPIVDLVRIHALANRVKAVNTLERLKALAEIKVLTIRDSRNLQDAFRLIMQTRMQSQVNQLAAGAEANNYINPSELSKLDRKTLRDAFSIVEDAQQTVKTRYRGGI